MNERPPQPPEGKLIADTLRDSGLSIREASRRAGISYGRWRQIATGYQNVSPGSYAAVRAPARTLARMARVVGLTPEQVENEGGRPDAAEIMRAGQSREEPPRIAAVPDSVPPGAELSALDRIAARIASATPSELEMLDAMVAVIIEGDEVAEGLWRFPDPKGPEGRLLPRDTRLAFIRTWLADDPRRALDDEGRQGTGTA